MQGGGRSEKGAEAPADLRVLLVINSLGPGGAEHSTIQMLPGLAERGVRVEIAALEAVLDRSQQVGPTPHHVIAGRNLMVKLLALRRLVRRTRPDLVHTMIFEADILGRIGAILTGVPVLSSLINMSYEPVRLMDPKVRRARLALIRSIDAVTARHLTFWFHAISEAVAEHAEAMLGIDRDRITVVSRGRDPKGFAPQPPERRREIRRVLGVNESTQLILSVGRHEFQKGHVDLVAAMEEVSRSEPTAVLMIAGREGNATAEIKAAIGRLRDPTRVILLGNRGDVADLMAAADVFAFPSLYEGLGGAMLEAMAMGLPIVCSDLPPLREATAGEAAILVPSGQPSTLSQALLSVLGEPQRARALGIAARRRFEDRFTLDRVVNEMAELYWEVDRRYTASRDH